MQALTSALQDLFYVAICALVAAVTRWVMANHRQSARADLTTRVQHAARDAVATVYQTFVSERKNRNRSGSWDDAAKAEARAAAVALVRARMPELDADLGAAGLAADVVVSTAVEAEVLRLRAAIGEPAAPAPEPQESGDARGAA